MQRTMLKSKIHRASVTGSELHSVGSITIDEQLLEAADILPCEMVWVVDVDVNNEIVAVDELVTVLAGGQHRAQP